MMMSLPVALQLYSIRDALNEDFAKTLHLVKRMGYDWVELSGLEGRDPCKVKKMLEDAGLSTMSSHVPFQELFTDMPAAIQRYKDVGCLYIVLPSLPVGRRPGDEEYSGVFEELKRAGKIIADSGMVFLYHNHDFEFIRIDGEYLLDRIYRFIPPSLIQAQIDTCWVNVAGENPVEYLRKYAGRVPLVHLKDFYMEGHLKSAPYELIDNQSVQVEKPQNFEFRPIGYGKQDIPAILKASEDIGARWVIVEQDESNGRSSMEAAKMSRDYLKSLGW